MGRRLRTSWASLCAECGPDVRVDEDGLCCGCGATCMGAWLDKHGPQLAAATERTAALEGMVRRLVDALAAAAANARDTHDLPLIAEVRRLLGEGT